MRMSEAWGKIGRVKCRYAIVSLREMIKGKRNNWSDCDECLFYQLVVKKGKDGM